MASLCAAERVLQAAVLFSPGPPCPAQGQKCLQPARMVLSMRFGGLLPVQQGDFRLAGVCPRFVQAVLCFCDLLSVPLYFCLEFLQMLEEFGGVLQSIENRLCILLPLILFIKRFLERLFGGVPVVEWRAIAIAVYFFVEVFAKGPAIVLKPECLHELVPIAAVSESGGEQRPGFIAELFWLFL